jgi:transposase
LKRKAWAKDIVGIETQRFVFFDESGAKTNMTRTYGRTLDGGRLVDSVPNGRWSTTSMLSSIRLDGSTAAMTLAGATDRAAFDIYIEQVLIPTLRSGDIVVMDNLAVHQSPRAEAMIRDVGAELWFLPPYSPDLNPIEKMWSKVKAHLCRAKARTERALHRAIAAALKNVTATDAEGWFKHCGYRHTQS